MKLIDAIKRVIKTESNSALYYIPDELFYEFELNPVYSENKRLRGYWLQKWYCTDTWVGLIALYLDDKPVGMSWQTGRKMGIQYFFIDEESMKAVRDFMAEIATEPDSHHEYIDPEEEIGDVYFVEFSGQILDDTGYVDGRRCRVTNKFHRDIISRKLEVKFEDNNEVRVVDADKYKIPFTVENP